MVRMLSLYTKVVGSFLGQSTYKNQPMRGAGQSGGVGRHASPHCTTIRRNTTKLKMKNTQNCQRITQKEHPEMYRSPTTTDLKKLYSSRRVGGLRRRVGRRGLCVAAASQGQRGRGAKRWRGSEPTEWAAPHSLVVDKNQGDIL